jgi:hypothetical protein
VSHTPGPWEVLEGDPQQPAIINNKGDALAEVIGGDAEARANVKLIAAAPELLEACKLICSNYPEHRDGMDEPIPVGIKAARAAIRRADGE